MEEKGYRGKNSKQGTRREGRREWEKWRRAEGRGGERRNI